MTLPRIRLRRQCGGRGDARPGGGSGRGAARGRRSRHRATRPPSPRWSTGPMAPMSPTYGRPVTAADTLKNVMVKLRHPDGKAEIVGIGVPGDREVDDKRLEAILEPAEVELLTEADFVANPFLVKGYIGPKGLLQANGVRYLVDPRVVTAPPGSPAPTPPASMSWVWSRAAISPPTAPSRPPRSATAIPRPTAEGVLHAGPRYRDRAHLPARLQVHRCLRGRCPRRERQARPARPGFLRRGCLTLVAVVAEQMHDEKGLRWPTFGRALRCPRRHRQQGRGRPRGRREVVAALDAQGLDVLFDDRTASPGVKFKDAELLGMPLDRRDRSRLGRRQGRTARPLHRRSRGNAGRIRGRIRPREDPRLSRTRPETHDGGDRAQCRSPVS